jgi:hypothetical protein
MPLKMKADVEVALCCPTPAAAHNLQDSNLGTTDSEFVQVSLIYSALLHGHYQQLVERSLVLALLAVSERSHAA